MPAARPEPELRPVAEGQEREFLGAVRRGFHGDLPEGPLPASLAWFERDRMFGFTAEDRWIATCGAFSRLLSVPGGAQLPAAAVTMVTVATDWRRRGLLRSMMTHQLADVVRRREPLAILWAAEVPIYGRFGYGNATQRLQLSGRTDGLGFRPSSTPAPGWTELVDRDSFLATVPSLHSELLPQRPGALNRPSAWWERMLLDRPEDRGGASALRYAVHRDDRGQVDGYALYRTQARWGPGDRPDSQVSVEELDGRTEAVRAALWRFLFEIDLVREFGMNDCAVDDPLLDLVADPRQLEVRINDALYVRIVDVRAALTGRTYAAEADLVIGVRDQVLPANERSWRLQIDSDGAAQVSRSRRRPDLELDIRELGAIYLGGVGLARLARAGLVVEHRPGAGREADLAFSWSRAPFCPDHF